MSVPKLGRDGNSREGVGGGRGIWLCKRILFILPLKQILPGQQYHGSASKEAWACSFDPLGGLR